MKVRQRLRPPQLPDRRDRRLVQGTVLAVVSLVTLAVTRSPQDVTLVATPVLLAFGIRS